MINHLLLTALMK